MMRLFKEVGSYQSVSSQVDVNVYLMVDTVGLTFVPDHSELADQHDSRSLAFSNHFISRQLEVVSKRFIGIWGVANS